LGSVTHAEADERIEVVGGISQADVHARIKLNVAGDGIGKSEIEGGDPGGMALVADAVKQLDIEPEFFPEVVADSDSI
jgi:hypothetical protein